MDRAARRVKGKVIEMMDPTFVGGATCEVMMKLATLRKRSEVARGSIIVHD